MIILLEKNKVLLSKGMSIATILVFFGCHFIGKIFVEVFSINNSMGWKWSVLHTWIDSIPTITTLFFSGIYALLFFLNIKTNVVLSATHLTLIGLSSFLYNFWELDLRITLFIICFSIIIFITNCYKSLINKNSQNNIT